MEYNSYEEYMNNLLGKCKPIEQEIPRQENIVINNIEVENNEVNTYEQDIGQYDILYPDIYKIIYPMVCKRCLNVNGDITEELVGNITNEIYEAVEKEEEQEEIRETTSYNTYNNLRNYRNYRNIPRIEENKTQRETRQRNYLLNDLIRILVLRELIGNGRRPQRPPVPPRPGEFPPPRPRL